MPDIFTVDFSKGTLLPESNPRGSFNCSTKSKQPGSHSVSTSALPPAKPPHRGRGGCLFWGGGDERGFDGVGGERDALWHEVAALPKQLRGPRLWSAQDCAGSSANAHRHQAEREKGGSLHVFHSKPWRWEKGLTPGCYSLGAFAISTQHSTGSVPKPPRSLGTLGSWQ